MYSLFFRRWHELGVTMSGHPPPGSIHRFTPGQLKTWHWAFWLVGSDHVTQHWSNFGNNANSPDLRWWGQFYEVTSHYPCPLLSQETPGHYVGTQLLIDRSSDESRRTRVDLSNSLNVIRKRRRRLWGETGDSGEWRTWSGNETNSWLIVCVSLRWNMTRLDKMRRRTEKYVSATFIMTSLDNKWYLSASNRQLRPVTIVNSFVKPPELFWDASESREPGSTLHLHTCNQWDELSGVLSKVRVVTR